MRNAIYVGDEFPDQVGDMCEVEDDHSIPWAPCYKIRFIGEDYWYDNMGDEDLQFVK